MYSYIYIAYYFGCVTRVSRSFSRGLARPQKMASGDKDALLAEFCNVTGVEDEARAAFFLESANWDLSMAISAFFEEPDVAPSASAAPAASAASAEADDEDKSKRGSEASKPSRASNVATLSSFARADDSDSDSEEGQAFYAGGSEHSGQQIVGPSKKKSGTKFVSDMFKKARESGAEVVDPGSAGGSGGGRAAFSGGAYRLGSENEPQSERVEAQTEVRVEPREFTLKMWSDGFSVDDGELRSYADPANRHFLTTIMQGQIPTELVAAARGGQVHVNMEDHKHEQYVKPPAKPFQGQGHRLGDIVPGASTATATMAAAPSKEDAKKLGSEAQKALNVDSSKETTSLQIRLPDGTRLVARLNVTQTIAHLRQFIVAARPDLVGREFGLRTTFPSKELEDDNVDLKSANLVGAAVLLHFK